MAAKRAVLLACLVAAARAGGTVRYATPDGGATALCACIEAAVRPSDACLLHAGTYEVGSTTCALDGARGTASAPIVIGASENLERNMDFHPSGFGTACRREVA